jgi:hypothetical protein
MCDDKKAVDGTIVELFNKSSSSSRMALANEVRRKYAELEFWGEVGDFGDFGVDAELLAGESADESTGDVTSDFREAVS